MNKVLGRGGFPKYLLSNEYLERKIGREKFRRLLELNKLSRASSYQQVVKFDMDWKSITFNGHELLEEDDLKERNMLLLDYLQEVRFTP